MVWQRLRNLFKDNDKTGAIVHDAQGGAPLFADDEPQRTSLKDELGRAPLATRIAATILARSDDAPLVLGIYGAWGDGKTTRTRG